MLVQKVITATLIGIDAALVEVEADVSNGLPTTIIVGLPDTAVQESRERVRSAIKHSGFAYPQTRVSLNLAPGTLPKVGTHFDLPIALAILLVAGIIHQNSDSLQKLLFIGELSLDGTVKSTNGVLAMVQAARGAGIKSAYVPQENAGMARLVKDINIFPVSNLKQLVNHLAGEELIAAINSNGHHLQTDRKISETVPDFADIAGQHQAKRALEIVAAGGHNMLMTGPPGSGKTMLARALPGIMPPLTQEEILDLTKIYNSAGKIHSGCVDERPFRNPHHTASATALIGGGGIPRPGEVTLAHHGVLFLDELPEFSRQVLEVLRQPLEDNVITVTRSKHSYTFPASFILVAAQNPCPCGNFGQMIENTKLECSCSPWTIEKYRKKISGPLLDRIDLHIDVPRLSYQQLTNNQVQESSTQIKKRITAAKAKQYTRFGCARNNSEMSNNEVKKFCSLDNNSEDLLVQAAVKYQLSGRAIHRIQKVARTIADLAGSDNISLSHLAESLQYRA